MHCTRCGAGMQKVVRNHQIVDDIVGILGIPNAELWECTECGHIIYPAATAFRVSAARAEQVAEFVKSRPVGDFVSAREAARLIGHSKQAFSKNQKIKNGFIYSVDLDKRRLYLRSSVLAYRETLDGRLSFSAHTQGVAMYEPHVAAATHDEEQVLEHPSDNEPVGAKTSLLTDSSGVCICLRNQARRKAKSRTSCQSQGCERSMLTT